MPLTFRGSFVRRSRRLPHVMDNRFVRVGVFYDGGFLSSVRVFYTHHHARRASLCFEGLHDFVISRVATEEGVPPARCSLVAVHYFRGRLRTDQAEDPDRLLAERRFEDVLISEGMTTHYMPLRRDGTEKGIDVWLALEAFEAAVNGRIDVCVLVTGDGDYVPLVRKLVALNTRVMVLGWDLPPVDEWGGAGTSQSLLEAATYPVRMERIIEAGGVDTLFLGEHADRGGPLKSGPPPPPVQASELSRDAEPGWETGRVKFVRDGEGGRRYGFVTPDAGGPDVWFGDDLLGADRTAALSGGEPVEYAAGESSEGRSRATGLRLIDGAGPPED